jgi:antitoxin HicB
MVSKAGAEKTVSYTFHVVVEPDEDVWMAYCPALQGCTTWGRTRGEALKNIEEAVQAYVESLLKHGEPIPTSPQGEVTVSEKLLVTVNI